MSRWRKPHGQYVRGTGDWFIDRMMSGGAAQLALTGFWAQVMLYNDAQDGSMLHVMGCVGTCTIAAGRVDAFLWNAVAGSIQPPNTTPINPFLGALAGSIYTNAASNNLFKAQVGTVGAVNDPAPWPHDYEMAIVPPGWSLVCQCNVKNGDCQASFNWLVMGHAQGF